MGLNKRKRIIPFLVILIPLWCTLPMITSAQFIPDKALVLKEEGDKAMTRGDVQQAVISYEEALKIYPRFPEIIYHLGLIYDLDFNDLVNATYYYRLYLELAPKGEEQKEIKSRLQDAERRFEEKKREAGIIGKDKELEARSHRRREIAQSLTPESQPPSPPPSRLQPSFPPSTQKPSPPLTKQPPSLLPTEIQEAPKVPFSSITSTQEPGGILTLRIQDKVLKYDLKLAVWGREGFLERFNTLAKIRVSPLVGDITSQRESLRSERKKVTEFINYHDEGVKYLFKKAILHGIQSVGIELDHFPKGWDPETYIRSYRILEIKEDSRFVDISIEVSLDLNILKEYLLYTGYQFKPYRIHMIFQGVEPAITESLVDSIVRHSNFTGPSSGGLISIYTSLDLFDQELRGLKIGKYRFNPISYGSNSITLKVISSE